VVVELHVVVKQLEMILAIVMIQLIVHHMMEQIFHLQVLVKEDQLAELKKKQKFD